MKDSETDNASPGSQDAGDARLAEYRTQFNEYVDNSMDEREEAENARDYFDGKQWTDAEIDTLNKRGQPVITDNKIKDKVEYMEGVERKTRSDPKAFPRTPMHDDDADVATDAIRYVFDKNRFTQIKSAVFQNLLIEGFGGCEVIVDKKDTRKILIRKYRWDRLYRDPYSMEPDCSDAMYRGIITWMDKSVALTRWPEKAAVIGSTMTQAPSRPTGETQDDKPRWVDTKRNRIQVFEHFEKRDDKVYRSVFVWGGFLEGPKECPYVNDEDEHEDPMVLASAYIDREGKRYGLVQRYISLQDEVNKRRSKSLHLLNTAQIDMEEGAVEDVNKARAEVHKPDGVIVRKPGLEFEVQRNLELSAAHFSMLQQAEAALSVTGPNAALLGQSGAISGRAKELDQQGGALQIGVLFDAIRDWQLRVARAVWNRIRQYWDGEMWIRVTDDERGLRFVPINRPMTRGDVMARQLRGKPPEEIQAQVQELAQNPESQMPAFDEKGERMIENQVAKLDVDIILDEVPDVINVQAEEFDKLVRLAESGKVPIPPDVLIEASQLRNKKQIIDKMSGANDPMAQQVQQLQQIAQQLTMALQEAEVREKNASADLKLAQTEKTQAETVATGLNAAVSVASASSAPPEKQQRPPRAA